ncbi:methyltransferase domain-containing protein [Shewanella mesophila]|uniref:methyltransferase domain-containing protein n=1 Tax=Shewanella mesophila TaxID=2864208 RepID=UPI001C65D6C7|nr:methyltransferase domain-containing protein [Shewanella mesophila]QYJ87622.1 methyltransferase domain-containing protein [Shewanella mesophila]
MIDIEDRCIPLQNTADNKRASHNTAQIAQQFSQAANKYQCHDVLQRLTAQTLLDDMTPLGRLLDIGCGPGTDFNRANIESVIGLDIAQGMLTRMRQTFADYTPLCADASALPLVDGSINTIYSNLALQWCADLVAVTDEMARVLSVDGECHLAIVTDGSLSQLQHLGFTVNEFKQAEEIISCFSAAAWQIECQQLKSMTVHFEQLKDLLYSIKGVGASVKSLSDSDDSGIEQSPAKLRGRQDWLAMQQKAELMREPAGLPLTYEILFIRAKLKG